MHRVSNKGRSYQLRVDMMLFSGETYYAKYSSFSVGAERGNYALHVSGYTGNAGNMQLISTYMGTCISVINIKLLLTLNVQILGYA